MAADGDKEPRDTSETPANRPMGESTGEQTGVMRSYKETSKVDGLTLPPSTLPIDHSESTSPKVHHASSRRRSLGRPSPVSRPYRSFTSDEDNAAVRTSLHGQSLQLGRLVGQVQEWIDHERTKNEKRDFHPSHKFDLQLSLEKLQHILHQGYQLGEDTTGSKQAAAGGVFQATEPYPTQQPPRGKRSSLSLRKLGRAPTCCSDTENETERHPPSVDVVLDNSKTLSYSTPSTTDLTRRSTNAGAWHAFKTEIVRIAHTLKLKGWRRVPLDNGADIEVQRLSGALTNAVYVVSPPKSLPESEPNDPPIPRPPPSKLLLRIYGPQVEHLIDRDSELAILRRLARKNIGPKLLGTFSNGRFEEYLNATTLTANDIRDPTLSKQIAKRMRELHVGIRLLPEEREAGPFVWQNWDKWKERCEEVIEWLDCQIKAQADSEAVVHRRGEAWRNRGLVCGVEWKVFRTAVRNYRTWLENKYGGLSQILDSLVFSHNDTQYGNLLRLMPDDKASPLLQPANQHRRLVVIDFEYANANSRGIEFANHFTEWCYNYHSSEPHVCVTEAYPTPEEQRRFIRAYVSHVPHFTSRTPGATPVLGATTSNVSPFFGPSQSPSMRPQLRTSVSSFMLDSRAPPGGVCSGSGGGSGGASCNQAPASSVGSPSGSWLGNKAYEEEERAREEAIENEVSRLVHETRLWRVANSAQWVAWGIVQAKVPGMEAALAAQRTQREAGGGDGSGGSGDGKVDSGRFDIRDDAGVQLFHDTATEPKISDRHVTGKDDRKEIYEEDDEEEEEEEEFDYLAYAQERALFFWGDVLGLNLVREDELPPELVARAKRVDY